MTTRIYLVRHAETEVTIEDRFAAADDEPLSEMGRQHAGNLAVRLSAFDIKAAYSSPLRRAMETALAIAKPHGVNVVPVIGLIEINHGHWVGMTKADVQKKFPNEYAEYDRDPLDFAPPGGEPASEVVKRAVPAFSQIADAHPDQEVLVVSHKAVNRILIGYHLGIDLKGYRDKLGQRPACLNILDLTKVKDKTKLMLMDDIGHYDICAPIESEYVV